ncbi:MAG TPA: hypothetical protein VD884_05140 [Ohtaekwangia sp.]|nr:hypothetical protein [Ohtaekwangia sp.]
MQQFLTTCLLFSIVVLPGCVPTYYNKLTTVATDQHCIDRIKPVVMGSGFYHASINVVGKHFSGLLFMKSMDDASSRVVFTSETGLTLFDFEYQANGSFNVKQIIPKMNKRVVIKTLGKDFGAMLGVPFIGKEPRALKDSRTLLYGVKDIDETYTYLVTTDNCDSLQRIEIGSEKKRLVSISGVQADVLMSEKITIQHYTFNMEIVLNKIGRKKMQEDTTIN